MMTTHAQNLKGKCAEGVKISLHITVRKIMLGRSKQMESVHPTPARSHQGAFQSSKLS